MNNAQATLARSLARLQQAHKHATCHRVTVCRNHGIEARTSQCGLSCEAREVCGRLVDGVNVSTSNWVDVGNMSRKAFARWLDY